MWWTTITKIKMAIWGKLLKTTLSKESLTVVEQTKWFASENVYTRVRRYSHWKGWRYCSTIIWTLQGRVRRLPHGQQWCIKDIKNWFSIFPSRVKTCTYDVDNNERAIVNSIDLQVVDFRVGFIGWFQKPHS